MFTRSHSITNKTLLTVGGICGLILVVATLVIYFDTLRSKKIEALEAVEGYGQLLAGRENPRFERLRLAHAEAVMQLSAALSGQSDVAALSAENAALFEFLFPLLPDGTRRSTQQLFDGVTLPTGQYTSGIAAYIRDGAALSDARKREILAAFFVILRNGQEVTWGVNNLSYASVHTDLISYSPDRPSQLNFYTEYAGNDLEVTTQKQFIAVTKANNPQAKSVCTPVFDRDGAPVAFQDSAECMTPAYSQDGQFLGAFGSSVYFSQVYGKRYDHAIPGRFDVGIVDQNGTMIVPPDFVATEQFNAQFQPIRSAGLPVLDWIYEALVLGEQQFVSKSLQDMDPSGTYHVGSQVIEVPQWYMLFFIKHELLVAEARERAIGFFVSCFVGLLIVCLVVAIALRVRFGAPLDAFILETRRIARSVNSSALDLPRGELPTKRDDEIGVLARSFDAMAQNVSDAQRTLQEKIELRTSELKAQKVTAEHASRAKTRFVASMSHELRTPLNAIMGFAEMLRDDVPLELSEDADSHLTHLMMSADHLRHLVEGVLEFARLDAGAIDIQCSRVDLLECIHKAIHLTQLQARAVDVKIYVNAPEDLPIYVRGESVRLVQIVVNLLSNAIKYGSQPGDVAISVSQRGDQPARLEVRDTGMTIPDDQVDRIFEPFERLENTASSQQGSGIGLSLCKSLLDLMNGSIGVVPAPSGGNIFWIELPCYDDVDQKDRALDHAS